MTAPEKSYRRHSGVSETAVEDDLFLVMPDTQGIFHLNAVGAALWRLLSAPHSRSEAATILASAFPDVAPVQLSADVDRFFEHLSWGGLIVSDSPAGDARSELRNARPWAD